MTGGGRTKGVGVELESGWLKWEGGETDTEIPTGRGQEQARGQHGWGGRGQVRGKSEGQADPADRAPA
jgi:hypothetical protein